MSVWSKQGFDYVNTTTKCLAGHSLKCGAAALQADLAADNNDEPLGVSVEEVTQASAEPWPTVSVETIRGSVVKMIASAAIAYLADTTATASGKQVTATKLAGTGIVVSAVEEYEWARALQATSNDNEYFTALFDPQEVEQ